MWTITVLHNTLFFYKALTALDQLHRVAPADRKQYFLLSHLEPEPGDRTTKGVKTAVSVVMIDRSFPSSSSFLLSPSIHFVLPPATHSVCNSRLIFPFSNLCCFLPFLSHPSPPSFVISPVPLPPSLRSQWRRKNIPSSPTLSWKSSCNRSGRVLCEFISTLTSSFTSFSSSHGRCCMHTPLCRRSISIFSPGTCGGSS